jgi:L-asparaginase II
LRVQTVLAEVTRGGRTESVHHGSLAVVDADGRLVAHAGDPKLFLYFRSSAKPFQAIPLIESGAADRFGFTPAELALCCASHHGTPEHQSQVLTMLGKLGLNEGALQCGVPAWARDEAELTGSQSSPLRCDCSGKHTGMLAVCLHLGYPIDSYLDAAHPLQQTIRGLVAEACRVPDESLVIGIDGCSLPTFGSTLSAFARAFAELARPTQHPDALIRLRSAMAAHPLNVGGEGSVDTDLMTVGGGNLIAKIGAEGLLCMSVIDAGLGVAIRIADGSFRVLPEIARECLRQLGVVGEDVLDRLLELHDPTVRNHNRLDVGVRRATFTLERSGAIVGAAANGASGGA